MKNILLLTDFSDLSSFTRSIADKIAYNTSSKLHVLKIQHISSEIEINTEGNIKEGLAADITILEKEKEVSEKQMSTFVSDLKSDFVASVRFGTILDGVQKYIDENNIDLVLMGVNEVSGIKETFRGSLSEHLIKQNEIPFLTLKCNRENVSFSNILLTGEFDEEEYDLTCIKFIQDAFKSKLHILYINTKKHFKTEAQMFGLMKSFAKKNDLKNVTFHTHNDESVEAGIVNYSNNYDLTHKLDLDLILVEKKHKSDLGYLLTGCQSTSIINHVYRPLMTYSVKHK